MEEFVELLFSEVLEEDPPDLAELPDSDFFAAADFVVCPPEDLDELVPDPDDTDDDLFPEFCIVLFTWLFVTFCTLFPESEILLPDCVETLLLTDLPVEGFACI